MNTVLDVKPVNVKKNTASFGRRSSPPCVHYWLCAAPENGFVNAKCRYCGETRLWETLNSKLAKQEDRRDSWNWDMEGEYISGHRTSDVEVANHSQQFGWPETIEGEICLDGF